MDLTNNKFGQLMFQTAQRYTKIMDDKLEFYKKYDGCPIIVTTIQGSHGYILSADNDPFYKQICDRAQIDKLKIRLWFPGTIGTMDFQTSRLNIRLKKIQEHLYEITKISLG